MALGKRRRDTEHSRFYVSKKTALTCYFDILPLDVLLMIVSEFDWDESWTPTEMYRDCPWPQHVRQWKILMLVCRTWHEAAVRRFYRTVYLFRFDQVSSLIQTLEHSAVEERSITVHNSWLRNGILPEEDVFFGYGRWIRRIYMQIYVPPHVNWFHVFQPTMAHLLAGCPSLQNLIEIPVGNGEYKEDALSSFIHLMDNQTSHPFSGINQTILFSLQRLQSLAIVLHKDVFPTQMSYFPVLRSLTCTIQQGALPVLRGLTSNWKLPDLNELSIVYHARATFWEDLAMNDAESAAENAILRDFCFVQGANVTSFTLDNRSTDGSLSLSGLFSFSNAALLPKLERLTYSYHTAESFHSRKSGEHKMAFESLRHISLLPGPEFKWDLLCLPQLLRHLPVFIDTESFPSLETIVLLHPVFDELPFTTGALGIFHPLEDIGLTKNVYNTNVRTLKDIERVIGHLELGRMINVLNRLGQKLVVDPFTPPSPFLDNDMQW